MNNCNTSPLFIPTTVIAQVKNLDAVDVAATNISCDNLTVKGENISNVLYNVSNTTSGSTTFSGLVSADGFATTGTVSTASIVSTNTNAGTLSATSISDTGSLTVSGASSLQGVTATSVASSGDLAVKANVLKVDTTNNKVGINLTTPTEALDVTGNIKASGTLTVNSDMTIDSGTLKVTASSNRVGVNTATPTVPLDVVGNTKITGSLEVVSPNNLLVQGYNTYPMVSYTTLDATAQSGDIEFLNIPSWATHVKLVFHGLKHNDTVGRSISAHLGSSGGYWTTTTSGGNYYGMITGYSTNNIGSQNASFFGVAMATSAQTSAQYVSGELTFTYLPGVSSFRYWSYSGQWTLQSGSDRVMYQSAGTLSANIAGQDCSKVRLTVDGSSVTPRWSGGWVACYVW